MNFEESLDGFLEELRLNERSGNTIGKYRHDLLDFGAFLNGIELSKQVVLDYKVYLMGLGFTTGTVNSKLSAVNRFLAYLGKSDFSVKFIKSQRRVFRSKSQDLTKEDYERLVLSAYREGNVRLALIMLTIACTGVRVSELVYITVESLRDGFSEIDLKGKRRMIFIPEKLCERLSEYADDIGVSAGPVFVTKSGNVISRRQVWREMKALGVRVGIDERKIYPHNFRHLFAVEYYKTCHDIVKLADILGHSSVDTTRIYLISTGEEHARQLDAMNMMVL